MEQRRTGTESAEFYSAWKNDCVITEHQLVREAIVKDYISGLIPKSYCSMENKNYKSSYNIEI